MANPKEIAVQVKEATLEKSSRLEVTFPTGLSLLDRLVGGGMHLGYLAGEVIRLVGGSKVGKTYMAMEAVAAAYHKFPKDKFKWHYDDAEGGFSFYNAPELWGLPIDEEVNLSKSGTPNESLAKALRFLRELKPDEFGIFILDSLDGLIGKHQQEVLVKEEAKLLDGASSKVPGEIRAEIAAYMSQKYFPGITEYLNKTSPNRRNAIFIFISQIRSKMDSPSGGTEPSGGFAPVFYSDTILDLKRKQPLIVKDSIFNEEREIGSVVRVNLTKTRTPRPERWLYFSYWFDSGLQEIETNIDYCFNLRTDAGRYTDQGKVIGGESMAKVEWKGETITRAKLIRLAEEDPIVSKEIQELACKRWEEVEASISTIGKRGKKYVV